VPSDIYSALSQAFTLSTEHFASPLNVVVETELYYSVYERDAIFGAQLDAYSVQWLGASEANPEYDTEAVSKALRWGIRSAAATEVPVLTVFILPAYGTDAEHRKLVSHPLVHTAVRVPVGRFNFTPASYTNLGRRKSHFAHFPVEFLVVANEAGRQKFFNPAGWTAFIAALRRHGAHVGESSPDFEMYTAPPQPVTIPPTVSTPAEFRRAPPQPPLPDDRSVSAGAFPEYPDAGGRSFVWPQASLFYTDGSQKDGKLGAGVFPAAPGTDPRCL
jgi:hypothetical protein